MRGTVAVLAFAAVAYVFAAAVLCTLAYGVAVLIMRHAFGVELPNPF